jgi:hypothetical protein
MGDSSLVWSDGTDMREIRGKAGIKRDRYGVVKFPKSMCGECNNARSQPFDRAYEKFSTYLMNTRVRTSAGIDFEDVYGASWESETLALARYYAKHFGCRMVRSEFPVPSSLRGFLDGAADMPDAQMVLVSTDSVHRVAGKGLTLSPDGVLVDPAVTYFRGYVMAAYVGAVGVRYEWWAEGQGSQEPDGEISQFFHFPTPILNRFTDEEAVMHRVPRKPGLYARFTQRLTRPPDQG